MSLKVINNYKFFPSLQKNSLAHAQLVQKLNFRKENLKIKTSTKKIRFSMSIPKSHTHGGFKV
jgi:hypothetical protein